LPDPHRRPGPKDDPEIAVSPVPDRVDPVQPYDRGAANADVAIDANPDTEYSVDNRSTSCR
jgi:hypothetical protein